MSRIRDHTGKTYKSEEEMCSDWGITVQEYMRNMLKFKDLEYTLTKMHPIESKVIKQIGNPIQVSDNTYEVSVDTVKAPNTINNYIRYKDVIDNIVKERTEKALGNKIVVSCVKLEADETLVYKYTLEEQQAF